MYLSGTQSGIKEELRTGRLGFLQTPRTQYSLEGVAVWAMDNGCYANTYPGDDAYLRELERLGAHRERCLFVAAPDVVADAPATLQKFPPMAARIRDAGWPVALVGQDGMEKMDVPWDLVDWLFVGGSTEWKMGGGAARLIEAAHAHGKRVHVGRVNSGKRFKHFARLGADTADGTYIGFGPKINAPKVLRWMREAEPCLPF